MIQSIKQKQTHSCCLQVVRNRPQIRKLILNDMFDKTLNETELTTWKSYKQVYLNFLGLHKSDDFEDVVANFLRNSHINGIQDVTQS